VCLHVVNVHHQQNYRTPTVNLVIKSKIIRKIIRKTVSTFPGSYTTEVPVSTNDASTNFLNCDWTEVVNLEITPKQRTKREHNNVARLCNLASAASPRLALNPTQPNDCGEKEREEFKKSILFRDISHA